MTLARFLARDDGTDAHHEPVRGHAIAMAPPSPTHDRIAANLARHLAPA